MPVPIKAEESCVSGQVLHFRDDEGFIVKESQQSSPEVANPVENEQPIPIHISLFPSEMALLVYSSQYCVHCKGALRKTSYHPYHQPNTFIGMPFSLPFTATLWKNLNQHKHGQNHKPALRHSGSFLLSSNWLTDQSVSRSTGETAGYLSRYPGAATPDVDHWWREVWGDRDAQGLREGPNRGSVEVWRWQGRVWDVE